MRTAIETRTSSARSTAKAPATPDAGHRAGQRAASQPQPARAMLPAAPVGIPVNPPNDSLEAEASAAASQATGLHPPAAAAGSSVPPAAPPIVHAALVSAGERLDSATRALMEPRLGRDLGSVRVHTGELAQQSARQLNAQAYTVGQDIVFDSGRYNPTSARGQWLLAHELVHTVQQGAGARVLQRQPNDLASYPEAERRSIAQTTTETSMIDAAFLTNVFGTAAQAGGATASYTFGGQTIFGSGIANALQRGLTSTGAYLAGQTNLLPLGSTVTLHLNLTGFQGPDASFRFSHFNHTEPGKHAAPILLIENVGPAPAAIASTTMPTGSFAVRGQTFTAGSGWSQQQFDKLMAVLNRLPDAALKEAAGITFSLRGTGTPEEGGFYDAPHDEIVLHQNAFPATSTTFGGAEHGMYNITHELGHLLDLRRLEKAWRSFNQGGQTASGKTQFLGERSLSGTRYKDPGSATGTFDQVDDRTKVTGNDFREAAKKDGIKPGTSGSKPLTGGPTSYSNTDWQELFAESFALYVNDPALFQILRPNLYQYFQTRFPLPSAGATASPQGNRGAASGSTAHP